MRHTHHFEYGRVVLSPLEFGDLEELRVLRNKEREYFLTSAEIDRDSQKSWYASYLEKEDDIMFKVSHRDNSDGFIGAISVYDIDEVNNIAEVGRTVIDKEKCREHGIGMEATKAVCLFAFVVLGMKRIKAEILKSNQRILKVDTRAGFYITDDKDDIYTIEMTRDSLNLYGWEE